VAAATAAPTFQQCAEQYIDENWFKWSEKHRDQWPSSLKRYAFPTIGQLTIGEIKPSHIFELLKPIWMEKRETSNRVRGRIETVIAKNVDVDDKDFRNPAELTKQLREKLPKRPKRVVRHHPALPYAEAANFMRKLAAADGTAAVMLRFLILTACRTNEVVEARWSEIDRPGSIWNIPGERMKMDQDHHVPLVDHAITILDETRDGRQSDLIFFPRVVSSRKTRCWRCSTVSVMDMSRCMASVQHSQRGQRNARTIRTVRAKRPSLTSINRKPRPRISAGRSLRNDARSCGTGPIFCPRRVS